MSQQFREQVSDLQLRAPVGPNLGVRGDAEERPLQHREGGIGPYLVTVAVGMEEIVTKEVRPAPECLGRLLRDRHLHHAVVGRGDASVDAIGHATPLAHDNPEWEREQRRGSDVADTGEHDHRTGAS
jgi:hypothetical protein